MRALVLFAALLVAAANHAAAGDLPGKLTIGYEGEGEVDASPAACLATVKELVEWTAAEEKEAANTVCAARQRHVDAYAALQKSYNHFAKVFGEDTRLSTGAAVEHFQQMVKACIEHKSNITTGGHNIGTDIIPNDIATNCLDWGRRMMDEETAWYEGPPESQTRAAP